MRDPLQEIIAERHTRAQLPQRLGRRLAHQGRIVGQHRVVGARDRDAQLFLFGGGVCLPL
jgi:hypothetical protein